LIVEEEKACSRLNGRRPFQGQKAYTLRRALSGRGKRKVMLQGILPRDRARRCTRGEHIVRKFPLQVGTKGRGGGGKWGC